MGINKQGVFSADGNVINNNLLLTTPIIYSPTSYNAYRIPISEKLIANQPYTIQFWDVYVSHTGKTADELGIDVYWGGGSLRMKYWHGTNYFTNGYADYLIGTFTPTEANVSHANASNLYFNIYNSVSNVDGIRDMSIGKWKLEKGSIATIWTPYESNGVSQGFIEGSNIFKVFNGHLEANEFIEF